MNYKNIPTHGSIHSCYYQMIEMCATFYKKFMVPCRPLFYQRQCLDILHAPTVRKVCIIGPADVSSWCVDPYQVV